MSPRAIAPRLLLAALLPVLAACQSGPGDTAAAPGKSAALRSMEQVATAAHKCWFAAGDAVFRDYSFANELNSFSGKPRFLLVPKKNFGGKPLLVVQAEGPAGTVSAFGPLMEGPLAARIGADLRRWSAGDGSCGAAA